MHWYDTGFDVAMADVQLMAVADGRDHLQEEVARHTLLEALLVLRDCERARGGTLVCVLTM